MRMEELKALIGDAVKGSMAEHLATLKQPTNPVMNMLKGLSEADVALPEEKGFVIARMVRAIAAGKSSGERPVDWALRAYGENSMAVKALAAGNLTGGGAIVPPGFRNELIEYLRPASVVRRMNPIIWPMPHGTAQVPKQIGGATASYVGENQNIAVTQPEFGMLNLSQKKLAAIVIISNDLIRYPSMSGDQVVRDDLVNAVAQREDLAFIRGTGMSDTPKGLRYWVPTSNPDNSIPTAGTTLANVTTDLGNLRLALRTLNSRMLRCGWLMSPRSENYLMTIRDGNGNYAFRAEMMNGRLWNYPYAVTTQIPENLGGGSNESEIYFVDFADAVIGEAEMLTVDASDTAAYYDGSAVQAAFSRDQTVVRIIEAHDFGMRHDGSVAVLTGVTWGV